jgi:NTE family protein
MEDVMVKRVLILSGGGAKGAFQAGVIEQLYKKGWEADAVAGISVGALNGSLVATGKAKELPKIWEDLRENQVLKRRGAGRTASRFLLHKIGIKKPTMGYFDNKPLRKKLHTHIGPQFTAHYYCGTVNINTGSYQEHKATKGMVPYPFIDPVIASTAIPVVFDPVKIENAHHIDGGVRHMNPIGQILKDHNPEEVIIITCRNFDLDNNEFKKVKDLVDISVRSLHILLEEIFEKDLREFIRINNLVKQAKEQGATLSKSNGKPYEYYKATLYQPQEPLGESLNFSNEQATRNLRIGREAVGEKL